MPKLVFPGGAFLGCSAGFVNFARIKGSQNALLSGILAAEKAHEALVAGRANDELNDYENSWRDSDFGRDLYNVRNVKPPGRDSVLSWASRWGARHVDERSVQSFNFWRA